MKLLLFPDVNTDTSSSGVSASAGEQSTDVNQASTSSNAQSDTKKEDVKPQTLLDAVKQSLDAGDKSASSAEKESAAELDSNIESDKKETADADKKADAEVETGDEKEDVTGEQKAVPYERLQEVVREKETLKQTLETVKPKADNFDRINVFCQENNITQEQFTQVMKIQALLNSDPQAALKELLPIVEALQGFAGDRLPQDLQTGVDAGEISLKYAKELASVRAQKQFGEKKVERDQQAFAQRQAAETQRALTTAVTAWEMSKRESDPDYKPKTKPTDVDGKWEYVSDKFTAMLHATDQNGKHVYPVRNEHEMVALMDKAYGIVSGRSTAKQPTKKNLSSNGSSQSTKQIPIEQAKTMQEAVQIALSRG